MSDHSANRNARRRIAIVGGGTFGAVLEEYLHETGTCHVVGFLDDNTAVDRRLGAAFDPGAVRLTTIDAIFISIGIGAIREQLFSSYRTEGIEIDTFVHPDVTLPRSVSVGQGSIILPGCQVMPFAEIGEAVFVSTGSGIAHHTKVGSFSSLASGARLGAGITVGKRVSLGVSSSVMTGVGHVHDDAIIGSGAVVIRDVEARTTVVGVPAQPLPDRR